MKAKLSTANPNLLYTPLLLLQAMLQIQFSNQNISCFPKCFGRDLLGDTGKNRWLLVLFLREWTDPAVPCVEGFPYVLLPYTHRRLELEASALVSWSLVFFTLADSNHFQVILSDPSGASRVLDHFFQLCDTLLNNHLFFKYRLYIKVGCPN